MFVEGIQSEMVKGEECTFEYGIKGIHVSDNKGFMAFSALY